MKYDAPRIETILDEKQLQAEVLYAGTPSTFPPLPPPV